MISERSWLMSAEKAKVSASAAGVAWGSAIVLLDVLCHVDLYVA